MTPTEEPLRTGPLPTEPLPAEPPAGPLPTEPLRVAAVQAEALPGDVVRNVRKATRLVKRAASAGTELVVFPELFLPAYHPPILEAVPDICDMVADEYGEVSDWRLAPLTDAAATHGLSVLVGASVRHPDRRRTISLLLVDAAGVRVVYDKQHLWAGDEPRIFTPGAAGGAIEVGGWRLGLGICYDVSFPEHARAAALAGAHAYVCPSAFLVGRGYRRDLYFPTRALENTMYVVVANGVRGRDAWQFCGGAGLFDPEGRTLARAPDEGEAVVCGDLDPADLARVRAELPMLAACRAESAAPTGTETQTGAEAQTEAEAEAEPVGRPVPVEAGLRAGAEAPVEAEEMAALGVSA